MKKSLVITMILASVISASALAAAPTLKVAKSIEINAPVSKVWNKIKDFDGLNNWHPGVAKDEIVKGKNNKVGAVRLVTLQDGGTVKEQLISFSDAGHSYKYKILEGVLPVSSYASNVMVKSGGKNKSIVTWSGTFKRKNIGDTPADNENDKTATDTISAVYQGGLDNLKKISK